MTTAFENNLKSLKQPHERLIALEAYDEGQTPAFIIEKQPDHQGTLAIYYEVAVKHGGLTPKAAEEALALFAEYTEYAQASPGKYADIDRLFSIIEQDLYYSVKAIPKHETGE
ncbi:DUF2322 family protein [Acidihalobacter prosperus]